jgi:DNA-binding NtrC family response regulator
MLCDLERAVISDMLDSHDGVKAHAADHLCLNRTTLVMKARKYGFPLKGK